MSIDLSSLDVPVISGDKLALSLRTNATNFLAYSWNATNGSGNEYPGGLAYVRSSTGPWREGNGVTDLAFRTYVNVSAVPEPTGLALVTLSSLSALWQRKRPRDWLQFKRAVV